MTITYDETINAMHIRFGRGQVAETIEVEPLVLVDYEMDGSVLGIEFVNAADMLPFVSNHGGTLSPETLVPLVATSSSRTPS